MITQDYPYIDKRILLEAKTLARAGFEVSILSPLPFSEKGCEDAGVIFLSVATEKKTAGGFIIKTKDRLREMFPGWLYPTAKRLFFSIKSADFIPYKKEMVKAAMDYAPDICFAHDLPALPIARDAVSGTGALIVYDSHEFFIGQHAVRGKRRRFFEHMEKECIGAAGLMLTVNDEIADIFNEKYGIRPKTIQNASECGAAPSRKDLQELLNIPANKKIVLYQGALHEGRNLEVLVEMAGNLPEDIVVVFIGTGFLKNKLKKKAGAGGLLGKKAFFIDGVSFCEVVSYTAGADAGMVPYTAIDLNTKFCTPNKLYEYISARVPIIENSDLVSVGRLIDRYKIGICADFTDPGRLAVEITDFLASAGLAKLKENMGKAAAVLSWEQEGKKLISYLNEAL